MNIHRVLIISLFLVLSACGGAEDRKAVHMQKAQEALDVGDLEKARISLLNVIQIDPKDAAAYYKIAEVFEKKEDFGKAFGNYNKAMELDPNNTKYISKVALFHLLLTKDDEKVNELAEKIESIEPDGVYSRVLQSALLYKDKKVPAAIEKSKSVFEVEPGNIENSVFLASMLSEQSDLDGAINVIESAIEIHPTEVRLYNRLSNLLFLAEEYDRTESVLKRTIDLEPDNYLNHVNLAKYYQRVDKRDDAIRTLRSAIELDEEDAGRKTTLISYVNEIDGEDAAISETKALIQSYPDEGDLRLTLISLQLKKGDDAAAVSELERTVTEFDDQEAGIKARVELARIYMSNKENEKAKAIIDAASEIAPNDTAVNFTRGKIAYSEERFEDAILTLRPVIRDDPSNLEAYLLLSNIYRRQDDAAQAREIMNKAWDDNRSNPAALKRLAKFHYLNQDFETAEPIVDDYLRLKNDDYEILSMKSAMLNESKKFDDGYETAQLLIKLYPNRENGYAQSVVKLVSESNQDEAIRLLDEGYSKTESVRLLGLRNKLQLQAKNFDDVIASLEKVDYLGDEGLSETLSRAYVGKQRVDDAVGVLAASLERDPSREVTYTTLAALNGLRGESDSQLTVLRDGLKNVPRSVNIRIALATVYERQQNYDGAIELFEEILNIQPRNGVAANNLAAMLTLYKDDEAGYKRAYEMLPILVGINNIVIKDTVGWVYYRNGEYEKAIAELEPVVKAAPDQNIFNYHLAMAYYKGGESDKARKHLEAALKNGEYFTGRADAEKTLKALR